MRRGDLTTAAVEGAVPSEGVGSMMSSSEMYRSSPEEFWEMRENYFKTERNTHCKWCQTLPDMLEKSVT